MGLTALCEGQPINTDYAAGGVNPEIDGLLNGRDTSWVCTLIYSDRRERVSY